MARPVALANALTTVTLVRAIAGVIAADNVSLIDANYPVASALNCTGFQTIWLGVEIAAGTNPTSTLEVLVRDDDAADGSRWKRLNLAGTVQATPALSNGQFAEVRVEGRTVFVRVTAVGAATSTTSQNILAFPGQPRAAGPNGYN